MYIMALLKEIIPEVYEMHVSVTCMYSNLYISSTQQDLLHVHYSGTCVYVGYSHCNPSCTCEFRS